MSAGLTEAQATAVSLFTFWWACIEAGADCDGEPLRDDQPVLSYCANGASALVTVRQMRDLVRVLTDLPAPQ